MDNNPGGVATHTTGQDGAVAADYRYGGLNTQRINLYQAWPNLPDITRLIPGEAGPDVTLDRFAYTRQAVLAHEVSFTR